MRRLYLRLASHPGMRAEMAAYIVAELDIHDMEGYRAYGAQAGPTIGKYGAKVLAGGEKIETLEGDWAPKRMVILEFESPERAREWWSSEEYRGPKSIRQGAAKTNMILIEGL